MGARYCLGIRLLWVRNNSNRVLPPSWSGRKKENCIRRYEGMDHYTTEDPIPEMDNSSHSALVTCGSIMGSFAFFHWFNHSPSTKCLETTADPVPCQYVEASDHVTSKVHAKNSRTMFYKCCTSVTQWGRPFWNHRSHGCEPRKRCF